VAIPPTSVPTQGQGGLTIHVDPTPGTTGQVVFQPQAEGIDQVTLQVANPEGEEKIVQLREVALRNEEPGKRVIAALQINVWSRSGDGEDWTKDKDTWVRVDLELQDQPAPEESLYVEIYSDSGEFLGTVEVHRIPGTNRVWFETMPQSIYQLVWVPRGDVSPLPSQPPRPVPADVRYFPETGFRINLDAFADYFSKKGGLRAFGYPISREFTLEGFTVQFFQRVVLRLLPDGGVVPMNLPEEGLFPYTRINFSTLPGLDRELIDWAPNAADPRYAEKALAFLKANVPDEWEGLPVGFYGAYMGMVRYEDVFPNDDGEPALISLMDLEIWGLPTSKPAKDPNNHGFVYQRFQRGILHYDAAHGTTQGLLLADYLKSLMTGEKLPPDLAQQAANSKYYRQYDRTQAGWVARPEQLKGTNLEQAFEREPVAEAATVASWQGFLPLLVVPYLVGIALLAALVPEVTWNKRRS